MYHNWLSGIYTVEDGIFRHWESQDEINFLRNIIKEELGKDRLWDEDGEYRFIPKDEYEGFHRDQTTSGKKSGPARVQKSSEPCNTETQRRPKENVTENEERRLIHPFVD
jgi:hypothetical protein